LIFANVIQFAPLLIMLFGEVWSNKKSPVCRGFEIILAQGKD